MKNNLLFICNDKNLEPCYITVPDIFIEYKNAISAAINSTFFYTRIDSIPASFIENMHSRDVLYKFIDKHTTAFFNSIDSEETLEKLIQDECKRIFNIQDENEFKEVYKMYKKEVSVSSLLTNTYKEKLIDYKNRLDSVEL